MRKIYSIFFAALALSAASCQVETIEPDETPVKEVMTITAGFNADTKTALAENGISTLWNRNDLVSVFDARTEDNNRKFSIVAEDDAEFPASTATFATEEEFQMPEYPLEQALIVALYPYQEEAFCNFMNPGDGKNLITGLNIPAEQIAVKDGFDPRAAFALATDKYTNKDNVHFKNLYSLLKVSVAEEGVKEIKVVISSLDKAVGKAQVVLNREVVDNVPVFNGGYLEVVDGSEEVTLKFEDEESTFEKDAVYGITVAPVCYNNIKVYLDGELVKDVTPSMDAFLSANKFYTIKDLKKPASRSLSFPQETYNVLFGNEFTAPELSGEKDGVVYTSSNEEVATVDETTGEVTIVAEGTTVITATAPKTTTLLDDEASYTLVVGAKADRVLAFNPTSVQVAYDATSFALPELTGEAEVVVYTSSDTDVATVDAATGEVTITGVGETVITASAEADETHLAGSASYTLTVTKTERTVSFAESSRTVIYGNDVELQKLTGVTDTDEITYSITEGEAATIENGALTLVKAGTVTITATVAATATHVSATASYTLTVERAQRTVSFAEPSMTVTYGDPVELPALTGVTDTDEITYSITEGEAATIENGALTLVKAGTVTITATVAATATHKECSASYTLTVEKANREISFETNKVTMGDDSSFLEPDLVGVESSDAVSYSSSSSNIVTVAADGNVKRVKDGTVTITATVAATDTHNECSASYEITVLKESNWRIMGLSSWEYTNAIRMYEEDNMAVAKNIKITSGFKLMNGSSWMGIGQITENQLYFNTYNGSDMTIAEGYYDIYISKNFDLHNETNYRGFFFVVKAGSNIEESIQPNMTVIGDALDDKTMTFVSEGYLCAKNVKVNGWFKVRYNKEWTHSWGSGGKVTEAGSNIYYNGGDCSNTGTYDVYTDLNKIWLMTPGKVPAN